MQHRLNRGFLIFDPTTWIILSGEMLTKAFRESQAPQ